MGIFHALLDLFDAGLSLMELQEKGLLPLALAILFVVLLLSIAARRSAALRRKLVVPAVLATVSIALVPGAVLAYYSIKLAVVNSRLENVADSVSGTVKRVTPELEPRDYGFVRVLTVELSGSAEPLSIEPSPAVVEAQIQPGRALVLWYRNDDDDDALRPLQLDVNGRRVLDWEDTRPDTAVFTVILLPIGLLLMATGAWILHQLVTKRVTLSDELSLVDRDPAPEKPLPEHAGLD